MPMENIANMSTEVTSTMVFPLQARLLSHFEDAKSFVGGELHTIHMSTLLLYPVALLILREHGQMLVLQ